MREREEGGKEGGKEAARTEGGRYMKRAVCQCEVAYLRTFSAVFPMKVSKKVTYMRPQARTSPASTV